MVCGFGGWGRMVWCGAGREQRVFFRFPCFIEL
ncbi:hypothetical protein CsSME_00004052 [Camellia sinensis var. sinensis]